MKGADVAGELTAIVTRGKKSKRQGKKCAAATSDGDGDDGGGVYVNEKNHSKDDAAIDAYVVYCRDADECGFADEDE